MQRQKESIPLRQYTSRQPCRCSFFICCLQGLSHPNQELRVLALTGVAAQDQCRCHGHACKDWRRICDEPNIGRWKGTQDEQGVHILQVEDVRRRHGPDVLLQMVRQQGEKGAIPAVPSTCHINDEPKEGLIGFIALVGVLLPQNRDKSMEVLQISEWKKRTPCKLNTRHTRRPA